MQDSDTRAASTLDPRIEAAFADSRERRAAEYRKFVERIFDEIATSPQPLTVNDVQTLLAADGIRRELTTIRGAVNELIEMERVTSRVESPEETLVRGAGVALSRRRPMLYAPTPGPVPKRTALPPGIEPTVEPVPLDKRVLELLAVKYPQGSKDRPRSIGKIADALDVSTREVDAVLRRLVDHGKVRYNHGHYTLASRRRPNYSRKPSTPVTENHEAPSVISVTDGVTVETEPQTDLIAESRRLMQHQAKTGTQHLVEQIGTLVGQLASMTDGADDRQHLRDEIARLTGENVELKRQLENLKSRISGILG